MKKVTALAVAVATTLSILPTPVYAWRDDYRHHHRYDHYRRHDYRYDVPRYYPYYGGRYYDPYGGYGGGYGYGDYYEYHERYFGDQPLRFRFRSPDFDLDIRG